jgi:hypothetical protein
MIKKSTRMINFQSFYINYVRKRFFSSTVVYLSQNKPICSFKVIFLEKIVKKIVLSQISFVSRLTKHFFSCNSITAFLCYQISGTGNYWFHN